MERIGVIGGSGLTRLPALEVERHEVVRTPYGEPSAALTFGRFDGQPVVFLPRHGAGHRIPPHQINYRANIWALKQIGIEQIIGMAAVGGISQPPETVCIPNQIIDYTSGRQQTFFDEDSGKVTHIDFTEPYCEALRERLIRAGKVSDIRLCPSCTYGVTQGPRLETAAEIRRMESDGCDLVGMTGMPEAALAREIGICYACCAIVVNWAAGKTDGPITMQEIETNLKTGVDNASRLLATLCREQQANAQPEDAH